MITPGKWKWRVNEQCPGELKGCVVEAAGVRIADVLARPVGAQADCEANAALIASAPDMEAEIARLREVNRALVDACKSARGTLTYVQGSGLRPEQIRETQREWEALGVAIALAGGEA